jgi:hypothetical protein
MADGNPVGKLFVALDMDASAYKKAQAEIFADAGKSTDTINKIYKNVGIQSDAMYDAMRKRISTSLDAITQSHKSSQNEITRAQESAAAKIKSINEQQFGHHTTLLEGLKKNWIAASVAIGAAMMATSKAMEYMEKGAKALQTESSFKIMAESADVNSGKMIASMKAATKETIDDSEMMQKAVKLMTLGYNPEQIERFSKAVITASQIAGVSTVEAYDRLADAIANRMPKAMVQMGAVTKEQMKIVTKAIEAGADSTALFELAMANLAVKTLMLQGTQNEATISMQRFKAQADETKESIGKGLLWIFQKLYAAFQAVAAGAMTLVAGIFKIQSAYYSLKSMVTFGAESELNKNIAKSYDQDAKDMMAASTDLAGKSRENMIGTADVQDKASKRQIDAAKGVVNALMDGLNAIIKNKKATDEAAKAAENLLKQWKEMEIVLNGKIAGGSLTEFQKQLIANQVEADKLIQKFKSIPGAVDLINKAKTAEDTDVMKKSLEEYNKIMDLENTYSTDKHQESINKILEQEKEKFKKMDDLAKTSGKTAEQTEKDKLKVHTDSINKIAKIEEDRATQNMEYIQQGMASAADAFEKLSGLAKKDSDEQKQLHEIAMAFQIAEKVAAIATLMAKGTAAVLTQGGGDPYSAFARMAAMAAAVAALLAQVGLSFTGGSAVAPTTALEKSTVLGAEAGAGSESISNSYKLMQETYKLTDTRLSAIYNILKDLNQNITGLVTSIVRTGGTSAVKFSTPADVQSPYQSAFMAPLQPYSTATALKLFDPIASWVTGLLGGLIGSIFGGAQSSEITKAGFDIGKIAVSDLQKGINVAVKNWAQITTTTDGGWFSSDSTSVRNVYKPLTEAQSGTQRMINLVFKNLGDTLIFASQNLGGDVDAATNYIFEGFKINLKGKTTEEITKIINEQFSNIEDTAASKLFEKLIGQYQKLGEGLLETATRLIQEKAVVGGYLDMIGQSVDLDTPKMISFSDALVNAAGDLSTLTDAFNVYFDKFFSDAEKQTYLQKSLSDSMSAMGEAMPATRDAFRKLLEGIDKIAEPQKYYDILKLAGGFDQLFTSLEDAAKAAADAAKQAAADALAAQKTALQAELDLKKQAYTDQYNAQSSAMSSTLSVLTTELNKLTAAKNKMNLVDAETTAITFQRSKQALLKGTYNDDILNSVTSIRPEMYSTFAAYKHDYQQIFNQISGMEGEAAKKVTAQQQQIDIAKSTYDLQVKAFEAQKTAIDNLTTATIHTGNVMSVTCQAMLDYKSGKISMAQLQATGVPAYAEGGFVQVGEKGPELAQFGSSARVYSNTDSKSLLDISELVAEVKALRAEVRNGNTYNKKTADVLDKGDHIGFPIVWQDSVDNVRT